MTALSVILGMLILPAIAHADPAQQPNAGPPAGATEAGPGDETADFGVAPQDTLQVDLAAPTPLVIPGGRVVTTAEAAAALGTPTLFIDVWMTGPHLGIPGSATMPGAGNSGNFHDALQARLGSALALVTHHHLEQPLIFLCTDVRCWQAYNAALRAIHLGYTSVCWYRGGLTAWHAAGRRLATVGERGIAANPRG